MLAQQDGDVSNKGNEADHAANHVLLAGKERLALGVELGIVCEVVVTLGEKAEGRLAAIVSALTASCNVALLRESHSALVTKRNVHLLSTVPPHYPVHDRNILALNIVNHDLANLGVQPPVPQEQQVSPLERRLHGPRQHNNNRRRRVADHGKSLPEHEGCRKYEREVQHLCGELPGLHASDAEHGCDLCGNEGEFRYCDAPWRCERCRDGRGRGRVYGGRLTAVMCAECLWFCV